MPRKTAQQFNFSMATPHKERLATLHGIAL